MTAWRYAFWLSLGLVVYGYLVYPFLVWTLARLFGPRLRPPARLADADLPRISLLIAAYNEEGAMGPRIANALALDYPAGKLEIVIASDGSSDNTAAIVRACPDARVRLLDYPMRRGKAAVLNAAFAEVEGDVVVLSDANTFCDSPSLLNLVRWFARPDVGIVCGRLVLTDSDAGKNVDGMYWKYETFLKQCESRLGALLGANGAIYAIRRNLFAGIRPDTLIDDFVIPLETRLRTGCALVYDMDAIAHEETAPDVGLEFGRRVRIGTGGFQSLAVLWRLLNPLQGWIAFTFFSHKCVRWLCPSFLIIALVSNVFLIQYGPYRYMLAAQLSLYAVAGLGVRSTGASLPSKLVRLATLFAAMNLALLVGFWRWLTTEPRGTWNRTAR